MSFARALFAVSGLTMLSRIAGFVRDTATAGIIGAGPVADAFFVAQRLPNLFRSLFAEGAFNASFVPLYTKEKHNHGAAAAQNFASEALAMMLTILLPFTVLMLFAMPWVMRGLAPGFHDEPEKFKLAVAFSQITFPYLLLISITALQGSVLNAHHKYVPAAAAPILYNLTLIIMLFGTLWGGLDVGYGLAWAVTLAGIMQYLWLLYHCHRAGLPIPFMRPRLTPRVRQLFKHIGPGALGAGAAQINIVVSTILASTLPTGAVSWLFYADRLNQLPLGVIGIAVATTLLPVLSQHVQAGDETKIRHYFSRAVVVVLAIGLPATVGLLLAAKPIIQTLFEHGRFGPAETAATAQALAAFAIGIPPFLLVKVFSASYFARHDTRTPVKIAIIALVTNMLAAALLIQPLGHVGIALASGIATWVNALLLLWLLRKQGRVLLDAEARRQIPRLLFCAVMMAGLVFGLQVPLSDFFSAPILWRELLGLALLMAGALLGYAVLVQLTGAWRWQNMAGLLRRAPKSPTSIE
jgi:putative peptidoglycan lipid II flippase